MINDPIPETIAVYNPTSDDFTVLWLDNNNKEHTLAAPALTISYHPRAQGEHLIRHLARKMAIEAGGNLYDGVVAAEKEIRINDADLG